MYGPGLAGDRRGEHDGRGRYQKGNHEQFLTPVRVLKMQSHFNLALYCINIIFLSIQASLLNCFI